MRPELTALPDRMTDMPVDERGYPVPWFVAWVDGKPEFRAMDRQKFARAVKEKLCWVCGKRTGVYITFVIGPMCGINRISSEPPSHYECTRWSAINCPFLNNPRMVRREDEVMDNSRMAEQSAGIAITRNPGVTLLWNCRGYELIPDGLGKGYLFVVGEPEKVEYWTEGRIATRQEVDASIESGLPALEAATKQDRDGIEMLARAIRRFEKWLPA